LLRLLRSVLVYRPRPVLHLLLASLQHVPVVLVLVLPPRAPLATWVLQV
jgi:hypothetical protein